MVASKFDSYLNSFDLAKPIQDDINNVMSPVSVLPDKTAAHFAFRNEGQDASSTLPCKSVRPLTDLSAASQNQEDNTKSPP